MLPSIKGGRNSNLKNVMTDGTTWFVRRQTTQDCVAKTDYMNDPTRRGIILFSIYVIIKYYTYININILYPNYYNYINNVFYLNYLFVFPCSVSAGVSAYNFLYNFSYSALSFSLSAKYFGYLAFSIGSQKSITASGGITKRPWHIPPGLLGNFDGSGCIFSYNSSSPSNSSFLAMRASGIFRFFSKRCLNKIALYLNQKNI